jgi:AraC-like DNA-binding protein
MVKHDSESRVRYYKGVKVENGLSINEMFVCYRKRFPSGYLFKGERHAFYEMVVVLSGGVRFTVGENVYKMSAGQVVFFKPGHFHAMYDEDGLSPELLVISFSANIFPKTDAIYRISNAELEEILDVYAMLYEYFDIVTLESVLGIPEDPEKSFKALVKGIKGTEASGASMAVKQLESFILKTVSQKTMPSREQKTYELDYYGQILTTMEKHISEKMTCARLAGLCNISVSLMEKTMYKHLGCGTMKYFNILKMQKALALLEQGVSVRDVGERLGFDSQSYFSTSFKRHFGYPPTHIKKGVYVIYTE